MTEKFNPSNPEYKKVKDLPDEHRGEFIDVKSGGFVRKEVGKYEKDLKKEADLRMLRCFDLDYLDLARLEAEEENRLRSRTISQIEAFDINESGLVSHGTKLGNLSSIIKYGLGYDKKGVNKKQAGGELEFQVIGSRLQKRQNEVGRFGFRKGEELYYYNGDEGEGKDIYLISDIFRRTWPKQMETIVDESFPRGSDFGQLSVTLNRARISPHIEGNEEPDYVKKTSMDDSPEDEPPPIFAKKSLGYWAFNGIVIPKSITSYKNEGEKSQIPQEEILKQVIEIQNKLLRPELQIPIYSSDGKCLYNPLKQN